MGDFANRHTLVDFLGKTVWAKLPGRIDWQSCTLSATPVPGLVTLTYFDPAAGDHFNYFRGELRPGGTVTKTYAEHDITLKFPS